uniref:Uncharacterized protein n=1 Tax=Timema shepardi TaxID=629360 RepID=A0A7R9ALJ7_TIMSH|nr:unnamed protein product [Timema shepardi]
MTCGLMGRVTASGKEIACADLKAVELSESIQSIPTSPQPPPFTTSPYASLNDSLFTIMHIFSATSSLRILEIAFASSLEVASGAAKSPRVLEGLLRAAALIHYGRKTICLPGSCSSATRIVMRRRQEVLDLHQQIAPDLVHPIIVVITVSGKILEGTLWYNKILTCFTSYVDEDDCIFTSSFRHSASSVLPEVQAACDAPFLNFAHLSLSYAKSLLAAVGAECPAHLMECQPLLGLLNCSQATFIFSHTSLSLLTQEDLHGDYDSWSRNLIFSSLQEEPSYSRHSWHSPNLDVRERCISPCARNPGSIPGYSDPGSISTASSKKLFLSRHMCVVAPLSTHHTSSLLVNFAQRVLTEDDVNVTISSAAAWKYSRSCCLISSSLEPNSGAEIRMRTDCIVKMKGIEPLVADYTIPWARGHSTRFATMQAKTLGSSRTSFGGCHLSPGNPIGARRLMITCFLSTWAERWGEPNHTASDETRTSVQSGVDIVVTSVSGVL